MVQSVSCEPFASPDMPDAGPHQFLRHGPCRRSGGEASRALSSRSIPPVTSIRCHRTRTRMSRIITIIVTDTTSARLRARRWNIPRPHSAQADNLRLCIARRPHRHGPFEAPKPDVRFGRALARPVDHRQESYFHESYSRGHAGRSVLRHDGAGAGRTVRACCAGCAGLHA